MTSGQVAEERAHHQSAAIGNYLEKAHKVKRHVPGSGLAGDCKRLLLLSMLEGGI